MTKKIALVTGAAKENGLGYNTAIKLAELGFYILPTARKASDVSKINSLLEEKNIDGTALQLDINEVIQIETITQQIEEKYGKLDVLINNAGINFEGAGGEASSLPSDTPLSHFRDSFESNVIGPISLTQKLLPLLKKSSSPRIVNVSSALASITLHADKDSWLYNFILPSYDMSKTALNLWTVELAWELRNTSFKVNAAHPGWVKTDMGGDNAPMKIADGIKTMVTLATLESEGPTGGFFHLGERIPW